MFCVSSALILRKTLSMQKFIVYLVLAGISLTFAGCGEKVPESKKAVWVKTCTVKNSAGQEVLQFPSRVKAAREVHLAFKVGGTLESVLVSEGQAVKKGQLIAQLSSRDYELQLQAVEAEYMSIKAEAERVMALYRDSVATLSDYEKAHYGLVQITAKYEKAKDELADTRIYAPFDGWVKRKIFYSPAVIGAGMPVVTLLSSDMPEVEMFLPVSVYNRRSDISSFSVKFDYMQEPLPLTLLSLAPEANANQLYELRLALPSSAGEVPSAGMSAMVNVSFGSTHGGESVIPAAALFSSAGNSYVWCCIDGKVNKRLVKVSALHTDGTATVVSGLSEGDVVVTAGVRNLEENQPVRLLPEGEPVR